MHHDLVQLGARGREAHEAPDQLGEPVRERIDRAGPGRVSSEVEPLHGATELREEVIHRGAPERLLRFEVVVDLRLVGVDALGDGARRGAVEPLRSELHEGGVEQDARGCSRGFGATDEALPALDPSGV